MQSAPRVARSTRSRQAWPGEAESILFGSAESRQAKSIPSGQLRSGQAWSCEAESCQAKFVPSGQLKFAQAWSREAESILFGSAESC
mmetsp:Transcript_35408/g.57748  ORF Transcript_35408/g.57748 Transcript_35408/m.57748 type:complete len:87 (+) Transcript_35408:1031-1291(+)